MKSKLTMTIVIMLLLISGCITIFAADKPVTEDFPISYKGDVNGVIEYGVKIEVNGELKSIIFKAADYNLPSNLFEYSDFIRLRITYTKSDLKVQDCKLVNYQKNEIIEDTSEENILKLFDVTYGKNTTETSWVEKIKLSTLKENEIYKYTASSTVEFPEIENDTGENCAIYIKEKSDDVFEKEIDMFKKMDSEALSLSLNEYDSGESFSIMYDKLLSIEEVLAIVNKNDIINLSKFKDGEEVEHEFEEFIYNDTDKYATIAIKNVVFGQEKNKTYTMGKGEIWGFDWMVDTATVTFSDKLEENNNSNENTNTNTNTNTNVNTNTNTNINKNNTNTDRNNTNKNNATNKANKNNTNTNTNYAKKYVNEENKTHGIIPEAGADSLMQYLIFIVIISSIVLYIRYRSFKDVK